MICESVKGGVVLEIVDLAVTTKALVNTSSISEAQMTADGQYVGCAFWCFKYLGTGSDTAVRLLVSGLALMGVKLEDGSIVVVPLGVVVSVEVLVVLAVIVGIIEMAEISVDVEVKVVGA